MVVETTVQIWSYTDLKYETLIPNTRTMQAVNKGYLTGMFCWLRMLWQTCTELIIEQFEFHNTCLLLVCWYAISFNRKIKRTWRPRWGRRCDPRWEKSTSITKNSMMPSSDGRPNPKWPSMEISIMRLVGISDLKFKTLCEPACVM